MTARADEAHMRRAIDLARTRLGLTAENPSVGCVVLDAKGAVVGAAVTGLGGRPHAEEQALAQAGERARGGAAYVTLEPCGARSSGGPSCGQRLVRAGVSRVVVACVDPSTFAGGLGLAQLREAGVDLDLGLLETEAAPLYAAYRPAGRE